MKADFLKYKHHLLVMVALLVANYVVMPLADLQEEQLQTLQLLQKKQVKTASLMNNGDKFTEINEQLALYLKNADDYVFRQKNEAKFKLTAQTRLEQLLQSADCDVDRIDFKGKQQILPKLQKWRIETRYKGDAICLLKVSRALETTKPYMNIEEYNYNAKGLDKSAQAKFNATIMLSVWYKVENKIADKLHGNKL